MNGRGRVLAILGPTASGKSALAVRVAQALIAGGVAAEIVGTDSMQCYIGMDIGTATPTTEEMGGICHHGIDVWAPGHLVSVAEFQMMARAAIDDIRAREAVPIVVGGSGLYVSAVLDDLRFPGTDPQVRTRWESELDRLGAEGLHAVLAERDPSAAAVILPTNGRRIVRALEVIELTGEPFAAQLPDPVDIYPAVRVGLDVPREALDARIAARVERMWDAGFVDEVRRLAADGLADAPTASRALGYAQVLAFLAGECSGDDARTATVEATRKFARRQQRWFRRDTRISWLPFDGPDATERVLALLA